MNRIRTTIGLMGLYVALTSGRGLAQALPEPPPVLPPSLQPSMPPPVPAPPAVQPAAPAAIPAPPAPPVPAEPPVPQPTVAPGSEAAALKPGPVATPDNPTGRQEPAVTIEWIGPPTAQVGVPGVYTIALRNTCNVAVQNVVVHARLSNGLPVGSTESGAVAEGDVLRWDLGILQPRERRNLQMRLLPKQPGEVDCSAWVTFTGSTSLHVSVREPKLDLKVTSPQAPVIVGDTASFDLTMTNPGNMQTPEVKVQVALSSGLEHAQGQQVGIDVGNLAAGETRHLHVICAAKAMGDQTCVVEAVAGTELRIQGRGQVTVVRPTLELEASGPTARYLDRKAQFAFKVTNTGNGTAANVNLNDVIPDGFKFVSATDGGHHDFRTRSVFWALGDLAPGQSKEMKLELLCINAGSFNQKATLQAARGLKVEKEVPTQIEGLSAILLEVVDLEDPVEVGADATYEIRITNTGTKAETNLRLVCTLPEKMQFKAASGLTLYHAEGSVIVFEPLAKLPPRADAFFRIQAKTLAPGDMRFKSELTTTNLVEPVIKVESTRVFGDQPDMK